MYIFSIVGNKNPVSGGFGQCMALCNPAFYHSFDSRVQDVDNKLPISQPIPMQYLECHNCWDDTRWSCQGKCADGYYYQGSTSNNNSIVADCTPCNTSLCPHGSYRELCRTGKAVRDAICLPCPVTALQNSKLIDMNSINNNNHNLLQNAINSAQSFKTRAWLSPDDELQQTAPMVYTVQSARPREQQCAVRCINNHAWINISSGLSPFSFGEDKIMDAPELYCIACTSDFIVAGAISLNETKGGRLYSIWNATNITAEVPATTRGAALWSMLKGGGLKGACYTCPGNGERDVDSSSTSMCEYLPGYTSTSQQGQAVLVTITTLSAVASDNLKSSLTYSSENTLFVPSFRSFINENASSSLSLRRRSLLQLKNNNDSAYNNQVLDGPLISSSTITTILMVQSMAAHKQPVIYAGDFFTCCDQQTNAAPTEVAHCRILRGVAYEQLKTHIGSTVQPPCGSGLATSIVFGNNGRRLKTISATNYNYNNNNMNRKLLQQQQTEQLLQSACYAGTYKSDRGDGPCYICPEGSSTSAPYYVGASSKDHCACLPGYYYSYDDYNYINNNNNNSTTTQKKGICVACANGTYRSSFASTCLPCPPFTYTPGGSGSAYCYCIDGTYPNVTDDACIPCEADFYCQGSIKTQCPLNSRSSPGAQARGDCICDPTAFYGDLSIPSSVCLPRPPGILCIGDSDDNRKRGGCSCAQGWIQQQQQVTDAQGIQQIYIRCNSPCLAGQYAMLQPRSQALAECRQCPVDSYSTDGKQVYDPTRPFSQQCTRCPPGKGTAGITGATSAANCSCAYGILDPLTTKCGGCAPNQYLDVFSQEQQPSCVQCPLGMSSVANSVGIQSCLCAMGHERQIGEGGCSLCKLGFYSNMLSLLCKACPKGYTTVVEGATSLTACKPLLLLSN